MNKKADLSWGKFGVILVLVIIGFIILLTFFTSRPTVTGNVANEQLTEFNNDLLQQLDNEKDLSYCLEKVASDGRTGINTCLGFGDCPVFSATEEEVEKCRDCLWEVYNQIDKGRRECWNERDNFYKD